MHDPLSFFLCALGLACILEGLPSFIWAEKTPQLLEMLAQYPPRLFRFLGGCGIAFGLLLIYLGKRLG